MNLLHLAYSKTLGQHGSCMCRAHRVDAGLKDGRSGGGSSQVSPDELSHLLH